MSRSSRTVLKTPMVCHFHLWTPRLSPGSDVRGKGGFHDAKGCEQFDWRMRGNPVTESGSKRRRGRDIVFRGRGWKM